MPKLKLIIVEPKYQLNLGYIARVAKNFGVSRLYLVSPRTAVTGKKAIMYAKHAHDLLENSRTYNGFDDAVKDCDVKIGTTGIWRKASPTFRRIYLLDEAAKRLGRIKSNATVGLIIGRDDTGLNADEMAKCDMVAYIGTNERYPVLNISHALAIMLYELTKNGFRTKYKEISNRRFEKSELQYLFKAFDKVMEKKRIRNKKAVRDVFRRIVYNSQPNRQEIHALITALK